jgi:probable rRNA maturation factor
VSNFCAGVLSALDVPDGTLTVVFVSARKMKDLNRRYLGRNYPTDVLSFGYLNESVEGIPFLGEVVIAPEVALRQALSRRNPHERELRRLLVHGILHLLGYDHETDASKMNQLQCRLLRRRALLAGESLIQAADER